MMIISLITINFNNCNGLFGTIESVLSQSFSDYEYLIIDGGSIDGSVELIKRNESKLSFWVSEADKGRYCAMNKGIAQAKGDYLLFLNSGDFLANNNVLKSICSNLPDSDIITGDTIISTKGGRNQIWHSPEKFNLQTAMISGLSHPGSLIRKSMFQKFGFYNEERMIVADWEFFLKTIVINNAIYSRIPVLISVFDDSGISTSNKELAGIEKNKVLAEYYPPEIINVLNEYKDLKIYQEKFIRNGLVQSAIYLSRFRTLRRIFNKVYNSLSKRSL
jgi:glycosyltransferase involved in cell wall biosynthesis